MSENIMDTLIEIRFKIEDGETLLPTEQELWDKWKNKARKTKFSEFLKEVALMLQLEQDYPVDKIFL